MAFGVKEVLAKTHVDYKVALGDYIYRVAGYENYHDGVDEMIAATKILNKCFGNSSNQIRLTGNHDTNSLHLDNGILNNYFSMDDLHNYISKYNVKMITDNSNPKGNYGYIDIPKKKIRIICLNTSDFTDEGKPTVIPYKKNKNKNTTTTYCISKRQIEWFIKTLKLTEVKDTSGWSILPISHVDMFPVSGALWNNTKVNLGFILSEYKQKHKGVVSVKGYNLAYDYSCVEPVRILPHIHGHYHNFSVRNMNMSNIYKGVVRNDVIAVGLPNACPFRNPKNNTYLKVQNTERSTVFSVIVIDLKKNIEYVFSYGAGFDRIIHFKSIKLGAPLELTTMLNGKITWSTRDNKVATVKNGIIVPGTVGNTLIVAKNDEGNCEY